MKKLGVLLLFVSVFCALSAQKPIVIDNPYFEVSNSGIDHITRVELTPTQTRVFVHTIFIPHWWVKFPTETFIQPEGGARMYITGIERGELDKEIYMSDSGDSSFVLIFPPLDKSVKSFDYGEVDKTIIFGVSVDAKEGKKLAKAKAKAQAANEKAALAWIAQEVAKSRPALPSLQSPEFFNSGTGRLVGYIKGYSPKLGFSTSVIYASNEITRESAPTTVTIHPDGRFEGNIPLAYPSVHNFRFGENYNIPLLTIYQEPHCTLGIVIDWEEMLLADRNRNIRWEFKNAVFSGPLASVNNALLKDWEKYSWQERQTDRQELSAAEVQQKMDALLDRNLQRIEQRKTQESLTEKEVDILRNNAISEYGYVLLEYCDENSDKASYGFLQRIPWNNQSFLSASSFGYFINQLEFAKPLRSIDYDPQPLKTFSTFLLQEKGASFTVEEMQSVRFLNDSIGRTFDISEWEWIKQTIERHSEILERAAERYSEYKEEYVDKYVKPIEKTVVEQYEILWQGRDSVLTNVFRVQPNLIYDIIKVRNPDYDFRVQPKEESQEIKNVAMNSIAHPFLKSEVQRMFDLRFPEDLSSVYELERNAFSEKFLDIIAPFKGKYIFVDFWATWCGPCIGGIRQMASTREKMKDSQDIVFLFITGGDSPLDQYNEFIAEHELVHTHRLSTDDFNRLRELFKFNGIPHYETIDREGRVLRNTLRSYSFDYGFEKLLESEKE